MQIKFLFICFVMSFLTVQLGAQTDKKSVRKFQKKLNKEYRNPEKSPLPKNKLKVFKRHQFFSVSKKYQVKAKFKKFENPVSFEMKTSTDRTPKYSKYGELIFKIDGKTHKLIVYQNHKLRSLPQYKNYLFVPFTDLTNGESTYEVGRYLDFQKPENEDVIVDFNKAYNPYCAYNDEYSCPIPPRENHLDLEIEAGIKKPEK